MSSNDPENLRISAGKALNNQLVPSSGATGGKSADLVTVVDFDSTAKVIYSLGDPAGAGSSFDSIDSSGGTSISDGVEKATAELTKAGNDPTKDRSGIIVLTDGESDIKSLITAINKASSLGIRVSFGFLAPSAGFFQPDLLQAILKTGGTYSSFDEARNIEPWLFLLLGNGLTAADHSVATDQPLLSGITVAKLSGGQPVAFSYAAQPAEKLVFTFESLSKQALDGELQDASGKTITKNSTGKGEATLTYEATDAASLKFVVTSTNSTAEGVFQASLNSSLGISGCNLNTTGPATNTTTPSFNGSNPSSTPTRPPTVVVTAGANQLATTAFSLAGIVLAAVFL
jgi:hypothetical protein